MNATDRKTKLANLRHQIGQIEAQISEIEGPDRCEVCVFADSIAPHVTEKLCRRYPPHNERPLMGERPLMALTDWCGEFKRRPE